MKQLVPFRSSDVPLPTSRPPAIVLASASGARLSTRPPARVKGGFRRYAAEGGRRIIVPPLRHASAPAAGRSV
jgi:hypothetical protein